MEVENGGIVSGVEVGTQVCPCCNERVTPEHFACRMGSKGGKNGKGKAKSRPSEHYRQALEVRWGKAGARLGLKGEKAKKVRNKSKEAVLEVVPSTMAGFPSDFSPSDNELTQALGQVDAGKALTEALMAENHKLVNGSVSLNQEIVEKTVESPLKVEIQTDVVCNKDIAEVASQVAESQQVVPESKEVKPILISEVFYRPSEEHSVVEDQKSNDADIESLPSEVPIAEEPKQVIGSHPLDDSDPDALVP